MTDATRTENATDAKEAAMTRLRQALPYVMCGLKEVATDYPTAKPAVLIAAQNPDGSGKMLLTVNEPVELFADIALVLDINVTEEDEHRAKAAKFVSRFGLKA